jgi:hypothetical protein
MNKRHAMILRWSVPSLALCLVLGGIAIVIGRRPDPSARPLEGKVAGLTDVLRRPVPAEMRRFQLEDRTVEAGVEFRHFPATRSSLLPEDMGSGAAWGDFDGDGRPDLFLVNFRGSIRGGPEAPLSRRTCRCFRNEGGGRFRDVSDEAGLALDVFGLGAAWGDFDSDGRLDLYITCFGPNHLMRNRGDGTFEDVTERSGTGDSSFSAGAAWADFDRDGDLDLHVCNYVVFDASAAESGSTSRQYGAEIPFTINPSSYLPAPNRLYRNNGDGTFSDVARDAGVDNASGRSLEAAWFDFDRDGWIDLYVANDVSANGVFRNRGDGTFEDIGAISLAADYRGAMGLAVGDPDHDGDFDLFVTHWIAQENAYFENMWAQAPIGPEGNRRLFFADASEVVGLGAISLSTVGWACGFADFDNDGHDDLWVVNGHTFEEPEDASRLRPQRSHLFANRPSPRRWFEVGASVCSALETPMVGRGGAAADYDGDGRLDLLIQRHGASPLLLRNTTRGDQHWIRVELRQHHGNTFAVGALVEVHAGGVRRLAQVGADASYLSQSELTLHFGLGEIDRVDRLVVHWPDGVCEEHESLSVDTTHRLWRE